MMLRKKAGVETYPGRGFPGVTEFYLHVVLGHATAQSNPFIPSKYLVSFIDFKASHRAICSPESRQTRPPPPKSKRPKRSTSNTSARDYTGWITPEPTAVSSLLLLGMDSGGARPSNRLGVDSDFNNATELLFPVDPALLSRIEDRAGTRDVAFGEEVHVLALVRSALPGNARRSSSVFMECGFRG